MTAQTRSQLYQYFITGAFPTQAQFANLIDSSLNLAEVSAQVITSDVSALGKVDVNGNFTVKGSALTTLSGNVNIGGALLVSAAGGASTFSSIIVTGSATFQGGMTLPSSANASVTGNIAVTGLTTPTGGIKGTATNDAATAGNVGEYISASVLTGAAIGLTSSTDTNITSIALTAGDWDVWVDGYFSGGATTAVTTGAVSISTVSATLNTTPGRFSATCASGNPIFNGGQVCGVNAGPARLSLAAPTTVYFVANAIFTTSTMAGYGIISARRVR